MISNILTRIFGSRNERLLKQYGQTVRQINALEPGIAALTDDELKAKTAAFRERVAAGETLDALLPEAFAVVREAGKRVLQMRHFDVQLIGGMVLHDGKIAEMRTGEGKTLVATLPAYLNALAGKGVHVVTVNDYLAQRDADWMGRIYRFLGLTVGVNLSQMGHDEKQVAYGADITYGTNNEFGFDYLRDNMVYQAGERVQRALGFAIVDEVDSILIDEARTPLIISGQAEDTSRCTTGSTSWCPSSRARRRRRARATTGSTRRGTRSCCPRRATSTPRTCWRQAGLLPQGASLYDAHNISLMHHLYAALRAHSLFHRDQHYVVQNGEIIIVDEFTGRLMPGRRWSDGLHQAVEAKEGVPIQRENQTLASITFQNYFRMYEQARRHDRHGGHRGVRVPADLRPGGRRHPDAPADGPQGRERPRLPHLQGEVRRDHHRHQGLPRARPAGAGRHHLDRELGAARAVPREGEAAAPGAQRQAARARGRDRRAGRPAGDDHHRDQHGGPRHRHRAGRHARAADHSRCATTRALDARAEGRADRGRCATNGRSCHNQVIAAGGLHIIGTERHESRRIDNQLRGRSGRQGDPGSSRFYLSLEDPLLRIFGGERVGAIMQRLKMPEGEADRASVVTRSIEKAQRKVEARNFDIRKQLLEYDDVANDQRQVIYQQRNELLESSDIAETIRGMMRPGPSTTSVQPARAAGAVEEQWDIAGLESALAPSSRCRLPLEQWMKERPSITDEDTLRERMAAAAQAQYDAEVRAGRRRADAPVRAQPHAADARPHWREHLAALDHLRQGIHLRGYAQKNPKQEYKREAFELFSDDARLDQARGHRSCIDGADAQSSRTSRRSKSPGVHNVRYQHADYEEALAEATNAAESAPRQAPAAVRARRARRSDATTLPVRLGQEVQAVPRPAGVRRAAHSPKEVRSTGLTGFSGYDTESKSGRLPNRYPTPRGPCHPA